MANQTRPEHPIFNEARGAATLATAPPFTFYGVTCRVFPLKANMLQLRTFCNNYLNIMPPEIAWYEPSVPYVFLIILNYGKMGPEIGNFGWVSQNEVAFGVALDWYKKKEGRMVFHDWGFVCPFIFVDEEGSLTTGREVYGWPKVKGWFDPGISPWAAHPRNPRRLLTVKTNVFPKMMSGKTQRPRTLLEIYQDPPPSWTLFPPQIGNPLSPMVSIPNFLQDSARLGTGLFETFTRPRIAGYDSPQYGSDDFILRMRKILSQIQYAISSCWVGGDRRGMMTLNCLNLKQFRDGLQPSNACYQAVTNSTMEVRRFHRAGMLGDVDLMQGDLSGGYFIDIHRYDTHPIIESLGIEIAAHAEHGGTVKDSATVTTGPIGNTRLEDREDLYDITGSQPATTRLSVARLRPILPLWMEVDLRYNAGKAIAWRTQSLPWTEGKKIERVKDDLPPLTYNTARGAGEVAKGPFTFPNATKRVFPLLATPAKLQQFVDNYLNFMDEDRPMPAGYFEVWGSYVYLVATNYGAMSSASHDAGWFAERDVAFMVPLKWYEERGGRLLGVTSVVPFAYANSGMAATTGRELGGMPIAKAILQSPPDSWMSEEGLQEKAERQLLTCRMHLIPSLNSGARAEERTLFEVVMGEALQFGDVDLSRKVAGSWGEKMLQDYASKVARSEQHRTEFDHLRSLALEFIARESPITHVTLKQFRDAEVPTEACFQQLLLSRNAMESVFEMREIEDSIHVLIHNYPSQPIVETLGLIPKVLDSEKPAFPGRSAEGAEICYLQPIRPFWAKVAIKALPRQSLCWRSGDKQWDECAIENEAWKEESYVRRGRGMPRIDARVLRFIQNRPPEIGGQRWYNLKISMHNWLRTMAKKHPAEPKEWSRTTVSAIERIEPQMALESILSQGWERPLPVPWDRTTIEDGCEVPEPKPDFVVRLDSAGFLSGQLLFGQKDPPERRPERPWAMEKKWAFFDPESEATALPTVPLGPDGMPALPVRGGPGGRGRRGGPPGRGPRGRGGPPGRRRPFAPDEDAESETEARVTAELAQSLVDYETGSSEIDVGPLRERASWPGQGKRSPGRLPLLDKLPDPDELLDSLPGPNSAPEADNAQEPEKTDEEESS